MDEKTALMSVAEDTLEYRIVSKACGIVNDLRESGAIDGKYIDTDKLVSDSLSEAKRLRSADLMIAEAAVRVAMNALRDGDTP